MKRINPVILLAALTLSSSALAQTKDALYARMCALDSQAAAAAAAGDAVLAARLKTEAERISVRMGGDRPLPSASPAPQVSSAGSGPQFAVQPGNCFGSPGTTYAAVSGTTGPIPDVSTTLFTAVVSGVAGPVWDVDLNVAITHTYCADLDISLTSPGGAVCDISSDNGGFYNDVFNGTLFDDQSLNSVLTYAYVDGVAAPDLKPEQSLNSAFRGVSANGTWTLTITDDLGADVGNLNSWSLVITDGTVNPPPTQFNPAVTFTKNTAIAILDNTVVSDTINASGLGTSLWDVDLYTEITHTWNSDLEIRLLSPAGSLLLVSDNRGGAADDVFNGTWFDESSLNEISTYAFVSGVAAPDLTFDGDATALRCEDPNGIWTLEIADQAGGDIGNLARWDLRIVTVLSGCSSQVQSYCTASSTTSGCTPVMGASALNASIGAGAGSFVLSATNVEGQKTGLIFYGTSGAAALPWATGSSSFLCVKAPTQRSLAQNSGGLPGTCAGVITLDFFAFMAANPGALGQPIAPGQLFHAQAWFRDPPAPKTTNLSNGIRFALCP